MALIRCRRTGPPPARSGGPAHGSAAAQEPPASESRQKPCWGKPHWPQCPCPHTLVAHCQCTVQIMNRRSLISREIRSRRCSLAHSHDQLGVSVRRWTQSSDKLWLGVETTCGSAIPSHVPVENFQRLLGPGPAATLPESARASRSVDWRLAASCTGDTCTLLDVARPLTRGLLFKICRDTNWAHFIRFQYEISLPQIINFKTAFYNRWRVQSPSQTHNTGKWGSNDPCAVASPCRLHALFLPVLCWFHVAWELFL